MRNSRRYALTLSAAALFAAALMAAAFAGIVRESGRVFALGLSPKTLVSVPLTPTERIEMAFWVYIPAMPKKVRTITVRQPKVPRIWDARWVEA